jgi:hypothetical protein
MNMYAYWFVGFMLAFMTVLIAIKHEGQEITEGGLYMAMLLSVGSWLAVILVCIGMYASSIKRDDDEE